jgi:peptidoglycan/LPS O-acetylase OafA/YrhL
MGHAVRYDTRRHNASLDGLRGVAAAAVVWFHLTGEAFGVATPFRGYLAVDFFFILSGLVIASAYEARLLTGMSLLTFSKIRLIRLYPLIALGLICGFISKLVGFHGNHIGSLAAAAVSGLFLIPYAGLHGAKVALFPLDVPLWSLMFELLANFFYAAAARCGSRVLKIVGAAAIIIGGGVILYNAIIGNRFEGGDSFPTVWFGFAWVSCMFFIGVGLQKMLATWRVSMLPSVPFPILGVALLLVLFAGPSFGRAYDLVAAMVIFPIIVALGTKDCISSSWRPWALLAGALSYPVYVLHDATFAHFTHFRGHSQMATLGAMAFAFILILLTGYAAMRWYDEPVRSWLGRRGRRPIPVIGDEAREAV